jgi:hypothetical protein
MTASFQHYSQHHEPVTSAHDHVTWRKSSHSGDTGNCIEAAALDGAAWATSSLSGTEGKCVEVSGRMPGAVAVRDSKHPEGARLLVPAAAWQEFTRNLKA